ncbi:MAG: acyltransferase family protein [Streptosporangiales bacterium]|nr:acyltransferase family protein [Streptosporangiales bacterium]
MRISRGPVTAGSDPAVVRTGGLSGLAARIEAATPATRERTVDGLRAIGICGIVLGHWLVTALVLGSGSLHIASPLATLPSFSPLTWALQLLGLFFLVGGYANARSLSSAGAAGRSYLSWLRGRAARLGRPVVILLAAWAIVGSTLWAIGVPPGTMRTTVVLVVQPLWFIAVYLITTVVTPLAVAADRALGVAAAAVPLAITAAVDAARFVYDMPVGGVNVLAAWLVTYQLGVAWARGGLAGRAHAWALVVGGGVLALVLVAAFRYPLSMVGITGAPRSNLSPPSLLVPAVAALQTGIALLLRGRLAALLARPRVWAAVVLLNLSAMTVFCWHQTALLTVTLGVNLAGQLPGLHTEPAGVLWLMERLVWLPVFAAALLALWLIFRRYEGRWQVPKAARVAVVALALGYAIYAATVL